MNRFIDREGSDLNKKILEVSSVERNEVGEIIRLYVEEVRNDGEVTVSGTELNASNLNAIVRNIANESIKLYFDEKKVNSDKTWLTTNFNISEVNEDFTLLQTGINGSTITWNVVSGVGIAIAGNTAIVTRELVNETVVLRATIAYETAQTTEDFTITVLAREMTAPERVNSDKVWLTTNFNISEVNEDFTLPQEGINESTITWVSSNTTVVSISNNIASITRSDVDVEVKLTATIAYQTTQTTEDFTITVLASDIEIVNRDKTWLTTNFNISEVNEDFTLPQTGNAGSTITWSIISGTGIVTSENTAIVTRELTNKIVSLRATITFGSASDTKDFTITILAREMSNIERVKFDKQYLIVKTDAISSFSLPTSGEKGSTISWTAAISEGVSLSGNQVIVNRGAENSGIILNANISYDGYSESNSFDVRIIGTNCYSPRVLSDSWIKQENSLESSNFVVNTSNLEGLYLVVENLDSGSINVNVTSDDSTSVSLTVSERSSTNSSSGTGSVTFRFNVRVYLKTNHSLLLGTIPGTITYYYPSTTPED